PAGNAVFASFVACHKHDPLSLKRPSLRTPKIPILGYFPHTSPDRTLTKTGIPTITFSILGSKFLHQNQAPSTNLLTVFQHRCRLRHASKVLSNKNYSTGVDGRLSISHP
ncbi:MAG: hypothetical protein SFV17_16100, partial [Candidatus Obscuribacter sp.]|nr:hypothetical protein [Candidatus Obscuribacter sp.]